MCPVNLAVMLVVENALMVVSPVAMSWSSMSEMVNVANLGPGGQAGLVVIAWPG